MATEVAHNSNGFTNGMNGESNGLTTMLTKPCKTVPSTSADFGKKIRQTDFILDPNAVHLNHGAYGATPKPIMEEQFRLMQVRDSNPELFIRYRYKDMYYKSVERVANFVGSNPKNLVIVDNATAAMNAVIKSLKFKAGDKILVGDQSYKTVKRLAKFTSNEFEGVEVVSMTLPLPLSSSDDLVRAFEKAIDANPGIKVAVIDHINAPTGIIFPVHQIIALCRERGILSLIDGAHTPGHIPLQLDELGADFYAASMYKWNFAPRGLALLWIHPKYQDSIHPPVTSHKQFSPRLQDRFCIQGCREDVPPIMGPAVIDYYEQLGGMDTIMKYNSDLAEWAADMLSKAWGTEKLVLPDGMRCPGMHCIAVPDTEKTRSYIATCDGGTCIDLMFDLQDQHNVNCGMKLFMGKMWARISVHVYHHEEDFYKLRDAVKALLKLDS
ncbi:uncharacterized protein [Amphiura filiformis]|uniref:uncharacterized protein n=1 Tax=Amphiura filiformis TaxID=82378 RepID=UPI003B220945